MKQIFRILLLVGTVGLFRESTAQNALKSYELVRSFSKEDLAINWKLNRVPKFIVKARYTVDVYEVLYNSHYPNGEPLIASGLMFLPRGKKTDLPLLCYNHGSEIRKERKVAVSGEQTIAYIFSTDGYAVIMPDYFGLGKSEKEQLYMNAEAEATASKDMLLAAKELTSILGYQLNDKLFLSGYSQGGHAAMATQQLLQEKYSGTLPITAASPMSGPYDILSTVDASKDVEYSVPSFLMLLLKSYYDTELPERHFSELLKTPYDSIIPPLLNGEYSIDDVDKKLPAVAFSTLKDEFIYDYVINPENGFRKYLTKNNVYDWKPEAPTQLCYCISDELVTYKNSITAYETMIKNGSEHVFLRMSGKKFHHENCALFAVVYTKMFFDSFVQGGNERGPLGKRMLLDIGKMAVKP